MKQKSTAQYLDDEQLRLGELAEPLDLERLRGGDVALQRLQLTRRRHHRLRHVVRLLVHGPENKRILIRLYL